MDLVGVGDVAIDFKVVDFTDVGSGRIFFAVVDFAATLELERSGVDVLVVDDLLDLDGVLRRIIMGSRL